MEAEQYFRIVNSCLTEIVNVVIESAHGEISIYMLALCPPQAHCTPNKNPLSGALLIIMNSIYMAVLLRPHNRRENPC